MGGEAPPVGDDAARAGGPRAQPDGGHHRHAEREDHRKGAPRGYAAAKKVRGRKRHVAVATAGLLPGVVVHAADIQDADGAGELRRRLKPLYCWLRAVFADGIDDRPAALPACGRLGLTLVIVRRSAGVSGVVLVPRRWGVERTLGWLGRWRRLAKDYEELPDVSAAMITLAAIRLMLQRLAPPNHKRLPAP